MRFERTKEEARTFALETSLMASSDRPRPSPLRFSLQGLTLWMLLAAAMLGWWLDHRKIEARAEAERRTLRTELFNLRNSLNDVQSTIAHEQMDDGAVRPLQRLQELESQLKQLSSAVAALHEDCATKGHAGLGSDPASLGECFDGRRR